MIIVGLLAAVMAVSAYGLYRLLRAQTPHPMEHRQTVDWDELRGIWNFNNGSPQ